jgi:hypothetical protein
MRATDTPGRKCGSCTLDLEKSSLFGAPGGVRALSRSRAGSACDEWHPVIFDIVDPNVNQNRILQYPYLKACIKLLQAAVLPPSIENSRSTPIGSTSTSSTTLHPNGLHREPSSTHSAFAAPGGHLTSFTVDLTGSDEDASIKPEITFVSTPANHVQAPSTQVEEKIQAFRDKLDKKEVKELQQMLKKQLPSWFQELAEDVLQKKMLKELELAESCLF